MRQRDKSIDKMELDIFVFFEDIEPDRREKLSELNNRFFY